MGTSTPITTIDQSKKQTLVKKSTCWKRACDSRRFQGCLAGGRRLRPSRLPALSMSEGGRGPLEEVSGEGGRAVGGLGTLANTVGVVVDRNAGAAAVT